MRRLRTFIRDIGLAVAGLLAFGAGAAMAQAAAPHTLLGVDCNAPPLWHCPDTDCPSAQVTQQGPTVEMKTRRPFFLDCPKDYHPGEKVNVVLSLHGAGSYGNWQRNYFPAMDVKDKYRLVIVTPDSPTRVWSAADDEYLHNLVDLVVGTVGKENVDHFILAGHSQGGLTSNRIICTDYFKDKVDVRISLSGGRIGPTTPAGRGFGAGTTPVYKTGEKQGPPPPPRAFPPPPPGPPGGACDYSFIFSNGEYESIPAATSPLADKFGCGAREQLPDIIDPKPGYVWDSSRQDPGTDGWGHYPKSGRALVYEFPHCKDGRVVADFVKLQKGHTEGYEPNVTEAIIALAVKAKGGKIAKGSWTPPPPPPPPRGLFG
ncbi:MAG TPA: alpha/beta hydrolase [Phenylobacterium sp.]|uniref:alpha/beta hydrolase n=1 Tax=Phenylobacterium sp. TaxID=1871053 RepID=UPI002D3C9CBE|nr:alpha/beta hydrolase [Phenylobacterium sp.]HZZ67284.1 alpha/beta hydrolase [Phenylobacterium sp.]